MPKGQPLWSAHLKSENRDHESKNSTDLISASSHPIIYPQDGRENCTSLCFWSDHQSVCVARQHHAQTDVPQTVNSLQPIKFYIGFSLNPAAYRQYVGKHGYGVVYRQYHRPTPLSDLAVQFSPLTAKPIDWISPPHLDRLNRSCSLLVRIATLDSVQPFFHISD